jgi:arsenate reductase
MKILAKINPGSDVQMREIKSVPLTADEVDALAKKMGSYEAFFSKRARKYRALGLHEQQLTEKDYRHYLLEDYTFLKRPVLETETEVIAGNATKEVDRMLQLV